MTRPLEEAKGQGPPKLLGPPTARVNRAVRGPCEEAETADAWRGRSWRDEAAGNATVPEASTRHNDASLDCRTPRQRFDSRAGI
jgi:hypothetical protein